MINMEDFCYVGECCICSDACDVDRSGVCDECGRVFCWGDCGTWHDNKHMCHECIEEKEKDES